MVRHKVLATLIISALIFLMPKSVGALAGVDGLSLTYGGGLEIGRDNVHVRSWFIDGNTTGCDSSMSTFNSGAELRETQFFSDNCKTHLTSTEGDIVVYNFSIAGRLTGDYQFLFNINPINQSTTEFTVLAINHLGVASASSTQQYQLVVRYNVSGAWLGWYGSDNMGWLYSYPAQTPQSYWINWHSIVWYREADTSAESEVADKELEGQDNIENQDTSGGSQGVSDDNYSSLLDIFSGFITAITNVSGGTCTISLNTDFANLGDVDLCAVDPPSYIQVIGSIILILLFVPLSMALINRILRTIQELQQ